MSSTEIAAALRALFPNIKPDVVSGYAERFTTLFSQSIYKWVQSPLSLHVGSLDLDRERALQMPVVQKNEWQ
jgi:NAD+ synthase (glutamine-hydrolysing)